MNQPDERCPHCHVNLGVDRRRAIGVQVQGVYDGVLFWQCPDCSGTWQRFSEGDPMFADLNRRARRFMRGPIGIEDH